MADRNQLIAEMRRPVLTGILIAWGLVLLMALAFGASLPAAILIGLAVGVFVGGGIGLLWAAKAVDRN
jgi:hypothetical protein